MGTLGWTYGNDCLRSQILIRIALLAVTEIVLFRFQEKESKEDGGKLVSFLISGQVIYQVHIWHEGIIILFYRTAYLVKRQICFSLEVQICTDNKEIAR